MDISSRDTALVVIDPQNDVLSEQGASWALVGESVQENNTVKNLTRLFEAAKAFGFTTLISPHFLYPYDQNWRFAGLAEASMLDTNEFYRPDPGLIPGRGHGTTGADERLVFGADWLPAYKEFIEDGKTVVVSPHKAWGPQTNDLVFQLRKRRLSKVVLAGMLANLCVESHLRDLVEQGIEVAVVKDATAGPRDAVIGDGYVAALINYAFIANSVLTTAEAQLAMQPAANA